MFSLKSKTPIIIILSADLRDIEWTCIAAILPVFILTVVHSNIIQPMLFLQYAILILWLSDITQWIAAKKKARDWLVLILKVIILSLQLHYFHNVVSCTFPSSSPSTISRRLNGKCIVAVRGIFIFVFRLFKKHQRPMARPDSGTRI